MANPSPPLPNIIYNVQVYRGVTGDRKLLSCGGTGENVDLWIRDDDSNRQKWQFIPLPDGSYNIRVYGGVSNSRRLLSTGGDGARVDLWTTDDGSGRQRWILEPLPLGAFRIRVKGGVSTGRTLLSCGGDGMRVDLWTTDDNSGRQQWVLVPEDVEIASLDFSVTTGLATILPDFVSEAVLTNNTTSVQTLTAYYEKKATETSSFEQQSGFTFSVSGTKNFGTPIFASGSITVSASTTNTWTYGKTETRQDTRSYTLPVTVKPGKRVVAKASVVMAKLDVPYTATGYSKVTGQTITAKGMWRGVLAGTITYTLTESDL